MVERLFVEDDTDNDSYLSLRASGPRAVPFLIRALNDPRTLTTVFFQRGVKLTANSPFQRICRLLAWADAVGAVKPLAKYLHHPDWEFREGAARVLAALATADCLEPVKLALADPERRVRAAALGGIAAARPGNPAFVAGVFPAIVPLLKDGDYDITGPAEALAAIDIEKAVPILENPEFFSLANPQLNQVLDALNRPSVHVPLAILLPLMQQLEPLAATRGPRAVQYSSAVLLYARNPDAAAEAKFRSLFDAPDSYVASAAANAMEILAGIEPWGKVKDAWDDRKFAGLTRNQQFYYAVTEYDGEVCNGGHDQYFGNSSGDHWATALEGLHAMGMDSKVTILQAALSAFPGGKPPVNRQVRQAAMDAFGDAANQILRTADQRYYTSKEKIGERFDVLRTQWALAHPTEFAK